MAMSNITVKGITPDLAILGNTQRLTFDFDNTSNLQLYNPHVPTAPLHTKTALPFLNNTFSGFALFHETNDTDTIGKLSIKSVVANVFGSDIMSFGNDGSITFAVPTTLNGSIFAGDEILQISYDYGNNLTGLQLTNISPAGGGVPTKTGLFFRNEQGGGYNVRHDSFDIGTLESSVGILYFEGVDSASTVYPFFHLVVGAGGATINCSSDVVFNGLSAVTFSGTITVPTPTLSGHAANKAYVDGKTWTTSAITDFNTAVPAFRLDQFAVPTASIDLNSQDLINVDQLQFTNTAIKRKVILQQTANNDHQFTGIGTTATNGMNFQVNGGSPFFTWAIGTSSTTSSTVMTLDPNTGLLSGTTGISTGSAGFATSGNITTTAGKFGIAVTSPNAPLQFANTLVNRKVVLFEDVNNDHQYYGLGLNSLVFRFQVSQTSADYVFYAATGPSASNELMRLTGGGFLGVGTATPHCLFQLVNGVANRKIVLHEYVNNDHEYFGFGINAATLRYQTDGTTSDHVFYAATSSSTSNELMRIRGIGRVGIGTAAPDQLLTVNSSTPSKITAGSWSGFSDARIKNVTGTYTQGLNEIMQLVPKLYYYNDLSGYPDSEKEKPNIGLVAQEIENIFPECITISDMELGKGENIITNIRTLDPTAITYAMINSIKTLNNKIPTGGSAYYKVIADQSIANNTDTVVTFSEVTTDKVTTDSDISISSGTFTINKAGMYTFSANLVISASKLGTGQRFMWFEKNSDTGICMQSSNPAIINTKVYLSATYSDYLAVNDTVKIYCRQTSEDALDITGSDTDSQFYTRVYISKVAFN